LAAWALLAFGCGGPRTGPSIREEALAAAAAALAMDETVSDATFVGRFIAETRQGVTRGAVRVRYVKPDIYRVDAVAKGVLGAGGSTSFLVAGDTALVYVEPGAGLRTARLGCAGAPGVLEDFQLDLEDLKALAGSVPYLHGLLGGPVRCSAEGGTYLIEGRGPNGEGVSVWIDKGRQTVVKAVRESPQGTPLVEITLKRFKRSEGVPRATRVVLRHFGQEAVLSVQYDRFSVNDGLKADDLLLRGMTSLSHR
jgi:hypothetical protein